ncbi:MAG: hypothetical protein J0H68_02140 [Sphingobacteriia bacterium]|nr:hypothetical protein [Sphingobacteriia bacterium]
MSKKINHELLKEPFEETSKKLDTLISIIHNHNLSIDQIEKDAVNHLKANKPVFKNNSNLHELFRKSLERGLWKTACEILINNRSLLNATYNIEGIDYTPLEIAIRANKIGSTNLILAILVLYKNIKLEEIEHELKLHKLSLSQIYINKSFDEIKKLLEEFDNDLPTFYFDKNPDNNIPKHVESPLKKFQTKDKPTYSSPSKLTRSLSSERVISDSPQMGGLNYRNDPLNFLKSSFQIPKKEGVAKKLSYENETTRSESSDNDNLLKETKKNKLTNLYLKLLPKLQLALQVIGGIAIFFAIISYFKPNILQKFFNVAKDNKNIFTSNVNNDISNNLRILNEKAVTAQLATPMLQ